MKLATIAFAFLAVLAVVSADYKRYGKCGDKCGGYDPPCKKNLHCSDGTCKKLNLGYGKYCGGCKECKSHLVCEYGRCVFPPVPCGGKCNYRKKCDHGLDCKDGKCIKAVGKGDYCGDCQQCGYGLTCDGYSHKCVPSHH